MARNVWDASSVNPAADIHSVTWDGVILNDSCPAGQLPSEKSITATLPEGFRYFESPLTYSAWFGRCRR